jgi:PAS domain S-box-containing protein
MIISSESDRSAANSHELLHNFNALCLALEQNESSCRGYLLTEEEHHLEAYQQSVQDAAIAQAAILEEAEGNARLQASLSLLASLAAERLAFSERLIRLRQDAGLEAAAAALRNESAREREMAYERVGHDLYAEELLLTTRLDRDARRRLNQSKAILLLGTVLGISVAAAAGLSVQRDVRALKDTEKHLAQMESRYRGLLEAAPDAMVVVNQAGEIVLLNKQAEKQFGYSRDELLGQKVTTIIPEGFAERLVADAQRTPEIALAQQIGTGIELEGRNKDGSTFPIEIMLSPLASEQGILVTAAIRDITQRKAAETHLLKKIDELKRSNDELEQFAYIASHDLQEPLRMVASYTQLLSKRYKGKLDADADDFIAFAVDGATRMQRLIQDLLTYSRVGTRGSELIETSSEEALELALLNLQHAVEESGALVTHDPLPMVVADATQLVQLFQNLVGNSIKYQGDGVPRIHISATQAGDGLWQISVKDSGMGIEPEYFDKIFGMFQRLHPPDKFAGTGIGLAVCKKIVERHGGKIWVESQPGAGSTFFFTLVGSQIVS